MDLRRRAFLRTAVGASALTMTPRIGKADDQARATPERLKAVAEAPVLQFEGPDRPVTIAAMELLRNGRHFLVRVRAKDGAEGIGVANAMHMVHTYPIFLNRVAPFFVGKDARRLEDLLWELFRHESNYKYQGLAFWVCVAAAEFAVLDLLGKLAGQSIGDLLGGVRRREVAVYRASGNRGNTPEEEVEYLKKIVAECGAKALKFRLGGRMGLEDSMPGRTEALIPLVREAFGPEMTLYADANSSYDAPEAIRIGRLMEAHDYAFYEEPCRFDDFGATKAVADALSIPIAGGEQESSEAHFRDMIARRVVDVAQPDLHYHGGYIRSIRVARMAAEAGLPCTPHISGSGLGALDAAHFVSCIEHPSPFTEYKGDPEIPVASSTASLKVETGIVRVPTGPGFGVTIDPAFLRDAVDVRTHGPE